MPQKYIKIRDECYTRIRKKKGKLGDKDKAYCKKMASITYWKLTGKPVKHADADLAKADQVEMDEIDLEIMEEQLDFFGSLEEYEKFNEEENIGK